MAKIVASKEAAKKRLAARSKSHEPKKLKSVGVWSNEGVAKQCLSMKNTITEIRQLIRNGETAITVSDGNRTYTVSIAEVAVLPGNSKLGKMIWSVSLPPILYCGNCKGCKNLCYDLHHDVIQLMCRIYRCINAALLEENGMEWFMQDVQRQITLKHIEVLRWNIGGDLQSKEQVEMMVQMARKNPMLHQLAFTKMYDIVNECLVDSVKDTCMLFPENLHIIFSEWPGVEMHNPYNFPISFPVYSDEDIENNEHVREFMQRMPSFYWHCGNDCTDCVLCEKGCFKLDKGEAVGFPLH